MEFLEYLFNSVLNNDYSNYIMGIMIGFSLAEEHSFLKLVLLSFVCCFYGEILDVIIMELS